MESCMCFPASFRWNDSCFSRCGEEEGDGDTCFPRCWGSNTCLSTCLVNRCSQGGLSLVFGLWPYRFTFVFRLAFGLDLWIFVWTCILNFIPIIIILRWKKKECERVNEVETLVIARATSNNTIMMEEDVMMVVNNRISQRKMNFEKMICRREINE